MTSEYNVLVGALHSSQAVRLRSKVHSDRSFSLCALASWHANMLQCDESS